MAEKDFGKKVPCEIYSRVSGYFRPVKNWNTGKQQEFIERKYIDVEKALNENNPVGDIVFYEHISINELAG